MQVNGLEIGPGAHLPNADLSGADLSNADLSGADLTMADLSGSHLENANFKGANLNGTKFGFIKDKSVFNGALNVNAAIFEE